MLGGGASGGRVVVIGEASAARRKYNGGRVIPTHERYVLGGVEIEPCDEEDEDEGGGRPRYKETGRCFLVEIPGRAAEFFIHEIAPRVEPGTLIWTDSRASYGWLEESGLIWHQRVDHSVPGFVGSEGQSTDAAEGMWARVKRALRLTCVRKPAGNDYGPLLAEYVWWSRRVRGPTWRKAAFRSVVDMAARHFGPAFQQDTWVGAGYDCAGAPSLYA